MSTRDTIFALATGALPSAIAIIRVSGPRTRAILTTIASLAEPTPRHAHLCKFTGVDGDTIDEGLVTFMPGPASYTGEDTCEFSLHGGIAVVNAMLDGLNELDGVRLAEPGELTRRAFENGKLDLIQAEAVADLIDAESDNQRGQALSQLGGALTETYERWHAWLVECLSLVEVMIDFPDEDDAPEDTTRPIREKAELLIAELESALSDDAIGERIRDGFKIAIIGPPNAGKSTLLNRLARRDAAIVTNVPGTTRDVIEVRRRIGSHLVIFQDTAGLRSTDDTVEREGIDRARRVADAADIRLIVYSHDTVLDDVATSLTRETAGIQVINKVDEAETSPKTNFPSDAIKISAKSGDGVDALEREIESILNRWQRARPSPLITRRRHRLRLDDCLTALVTARDGLASGNGAEFVSEDLRRAAFHLGALTGRVDVEDVLDGVFSSFCIGK